MPLLKILPAGLVCVWCDGFVLAREGRYKREGEARLPAIFVSISLPGQHPSIPQGKDTISDDIDQNFKVLIQKVLKKCCALSGGV